MNKTYDNDKSKISKLTQQEDRITQGFKKFVTGVSTSLKSFAKGAKKVVKALSSFGLKLNHGSGDRSIYGPKGKVNKIHVYNGAKALQVGPGKHARRTANLIKK